MLEKLQKSSQLAMEFFSKANLFIYCCVSAVFSLITYLAAFSCEISWILEAKGNLPIAAYLLCAGFFILFVASTILIHGLVTGLSWGLFSWSLVIGAIAIPELCLVMFMTIQYWGLQSTHGLTELIGYLIRLIVNCLALMCVIPTASKWRQEKKILSQLQSLAERLQLTTPLPNQHQQHGTTGSGLPVQKANSTISNGSGLVHSISSNNNNNNNTSTNTLNGSKRLGGGSRRSSSTGVDNLAFVTTEPPSPPPTDAMIEYSQKYGSQNEFDASIFGLNPLMYIGPLPAETAAKRTQSLLDLRYAVAAPTLPPKPGPVDSTDETDHHSGHTQKNNAKNKLNNNDHIYNTIRSNKSAKALGRNCVSLENLCAITRTFKNDLNSNYNNNLMHNGGKFIQAPDYWGYAAVPVAASPYHYYYQQYPIQFYNCPLPPFDGYNFYNVNYNNPYINTSSNTNSRQSLGNASDDFRKYRDVAL